MSLFDIKITGFSREDCSTSRTFLRAFPVPGDMDADSVLRQILLDVRTIAVVGMSKDPSKDAHQIPVDMAARGYKIIPVNPTAERIGEWKSYPSLGQIEEPIDCIQVFRPSAEGVRIVQEAIHKGVRTVWMQTGIRNEEARELGASAGITVIMDRCMRDEYVRLIATRTNG